MPTEISNAVGTARQFTPQPQSSYQGTYGGVNPTRFQANTSKEVQLAQSIQQLSNALLSYRVRHEEYKDKKGLAEAERMVNGMSPEDIEKLNMIDATQTYGYVDASANPYFRAHVDKLRGGIIATRIKQSFEEKYADFQPTSIEEIQDLWTQHIEDSRSKLMETNPPENIQAFDAGYYEQNLISSVQLVNGYLEKKHQENQMVSLVSSRNNLNLFTDMLPSLMQAEPNVRIEALQTAVNGIRLSPLPLSEKYKMITQWGEEVICTGLLSAEDFQKLCEGVTAHTRLDGSEVTIADLLDMEDLKEVSAKYKGMVATVDNKSFIEDTLKLGVTQARITIGEWLEEKRKLDPANIESHLKVYNEVNRRCDEIERANRITRNQKYQQSEKQNEVQYQRRSLDPIVKAYMNGGTAFDGKSFEECKKDFDIEIRREHFHQDMQYALIANPTMSDATRTEYIAKIMNNPLYSDLTKDYKASMIATLDNVREIDGEGKSYNKEAHLLLDMYMANPSAFQKGYGQEVSDKVALLSTLVRYAGGDREKGMGLFAQWNLSDQATKEQAEEKAKESFNKKSTARILSGIQKLGGGMINNVTATANVEGCMKETAKVLYALGRLNPDNLSSLSETIKNNYYYYRGDFIPKGVVSGTMTGNDELMIYTQLENYIPYAFGNDVDADEVTFQYKAGMCFLYHKGQTFSVTISKLRNDALWTFNQMIKEGQEVQYESQSAIQNRIDTAPIMW